MLYIKSLRNFWIKSSTLTARLGTCVSFIIWILRRSWEKSSKGYRTKDCTTSSLIVPITTISTKKQTANRVQNKSSTCNLWLTSSGSSKDWQIMKWNTLQRLQISSDISYNRTEVLKSIDQVRMVWPRNSSCWWIAWWKSCVMRGASGKWCFTRAPPTTMSMSGEARRKYKYRKEINRKEINRKKINRKEINRKEIKTRMVVRIKQLAKCSKA